MHKKSVTNEALVTGNIKVVKCMKSMQKSKHSRPWVESSNIFHIQKSQVLMT